MNRSPSGEQANARYSLQLLPYEIVSEILVFAWNLLPPLSRRQFDFPCGTMLVCKYWKQVTCNTPTVWSTVLISYPWTEDCSKVGRRLCRTIPCPIDVVFSDRAADSDRPIYFRLRVRDQQSPLKSLVQELTTYRTRIWTLQINIHSSELSGIVYKELVGNEQGTTRAALAPPMPSSSPPPLTPLSLLRHLTIQSSLTADWSVYINVPFMRTITCDHPLANLDFTSPRFPSKAFGRLTKLNIEESLWHTGDGRRFISILEQNPGLEVLSIPLTYLVDEDKSGEVPIQLPSLYYLRISESYSNPYLAMSILSMFNAPNLRDLVMGVAGEIFGITQVESTLRFCALHVITNDIPKYLPSTTHLTLVDCNPHDLAKLIHQIDTFNIVECSPSAGFPMPKLHTLTTEKNSLASIVELIRVRPSIKTVQVLSEDLCWMPPETGVGFDRCSNTFGEHQAHLEWLKDHVQVEIWGPSFGEFYGSPNLEQNHLVKTLESWLVSWSGGLTWIDQTNVWRGELP